MIWLLFRTVHLQGLSLKGELLARQERSSRLSVAYGVEAQNVDHPISIIRLPTFLLFLP